MQCKKKCTGQVWVCAMDGDDEEKGREEKVNKSKFSHNKTEGVKLVRYVPSFVDILRRQPQVMTKGYFHFPHPI